MAVEKSMMFRDAPSVVQCKWEMRMRTYKVTFELRIVGRSAGKWNFLLYEIGGA